MIKACSYRIVSLREPQQEGTSPMRTFRKRPANILSSPQVCNIEEMIRISPIALIAVIDSCLRILGFLKNISTSLHRSMVVYIAGIVFFEKKQSASLIAKRIGGVSHDKMTRLLAKAHWKNSAVIIRFISLIQRLGLKGYLVIDDTAVQHKRSKKVKGVYWDFDHAENRNILCQRLVLVLWSNGYLRIPVGYAIWHKKGARKKYRTKNELAQTLVKWALHRGLKPEYVTFDNWYASVENMKLFAKVLKVPFVTKLKTNRQLIYNGKKMSAKELGKELLAEKRQYISKKTGVWSRKARVSLGSGLGYMCFVVFKDELDGEKSGIKHLLASTPELSAMTVVQRYRSRWIIETLFQDLKQHCGFSHYQGRSLEGSYRHFTLCFIALIILDILRKKEGRSLRETKTKLSSMFFIRDEAGIYHQAVLQSTTEQELGSLNEVINVVREQVRDSLPPDYDLLSKLVA
jgi:SRSO17 transposase